MKIHYLTRHDVIALLVTERGGETMTDFALHMGVSLGYLNDVLKGRTKPGPKILTYLSRNKKTETLEECEAYVFAERKPL